MELWEVGIRLFFAFILGALIGLERQWHQRTAGIRTNALVCIGACGFVVFSAFFPHSDSPTRIAAQIVSGVGFLGAGVIMREGFSIIGLNSAATIWCASTVGVFCGAGYYKQAGLLTGVILTVNLLLREFIAKIKDKLYPEEVVGGYHYTLSITCADTYETQLRSFLNQAVEGKRVDISSFNVLTHEEKNYCLFNVTINSGRPCDKFLNDLVSQLTLTPQVSSAKWFGASQATVEI